MQYFRFLPSMWETWPEFPAPCFSFSPGSLQVFGEGSSAWGVLFFLPVKKKKQ